jgi:hypothetical protein
VATVDEALGGSSPDELHRRDVRNAGFPPPAVGGAKQIGRCAKRPSGGLENRSDLRAGRRRIVGELNERHGHGFFGPLVAGALNCAGVPVLAQTRSLELEDFFKVKRVADPQISPDGQRVASLRYFTLNLTKPISQRTRSPGHRAHRADKVFGSVSSVRNSVRSVKMNLFRKV